MITNNITTATNPTELKNLLRDWILDIDREETLPREIIALNFNIYEETIDIDRPLDNTNWAYFIDLIGSPRFDEEDEDWACDDDDAFEPNKRMGPKWTYPKEIEWEEVEEEIGRVLLELITELHDLPLFQVEHIAFGHNDGTLTIIK